MKRRKSWLAKAIAAVALVCAIAFALFRFVFVVRSVDVIGAPAEEAPEIVRQGGQFGIRLKAHAPSLHLIRVDIETEVTPTVGTEEQSEELARQMSSELESDPQKMWAMSFFGKPLSDMVREGLNGKLMRMPADAQEKVQETLTRIINDGDGGMICILL